MNGGVYLGAGDIEKELFCLCTCKSENPRVTATCKSDISTCIWLVSCFDFLFSVMVYCFTVSSPRRNGKLAASKKLTKLPSMADRSRSRSDNRYLR